MKCYFLILFTLSIATSVSFAQEAVIQDILNHVALTSSDYESLFKAADRQTFIYGPQCAPASQTEKSNEDLPEVFGDQKFYARFFSDPVFQKISLYIYFNRVAEVVPDDYISSFTAYAKAFYILYRNGLIKSPNLRHLTIDQAASLTDFFLDNRDVKLRKPATSEEQWAYRIVTERNFQLPDQVAGAKRFSSAMIKVMEKIAQYETVCAMSPIETTALAIYIGMGFKHLNSYLRGNNKTDPVLNLLEKLTNQALDKIADSNRMVFRTTMFLGQPDLPEAVYRQHTVGRYLEYQAFTSTAVTPIRNANFLIYSRFGKELGRLSIEDEILFRSKTKFKVRYNSCEEENQRVWQGCHVVLEEVGTVDRFN